MKYLNIILLLSLSLGSSSFLSAMTPKSSIMISEDTGITEAHKIIMIEPERIDELLENDDEDLNVQDKQGRTLLHMAVRYKRNMAVIGQDRIKIIPRLIEAGADKDAQDKDGNTPLHKAIEEKNEIAARALLEKGASLEITNDNCLTPYHIANQDMLELIGEFDPDIKEREIRRRRNKYFIDMIPYIFAAFAIYEVIFLPEG